MKLENIIEGAKKHISDGTAVAAVYTPVYALMETTIANMSHELSQDARLLGIATIYGGLGNLIGKGRDISRRKFKITEETSEKIQKIHDTVYLAGTAVVINPPFYLLAGSRDPEEILWGTIAGAGIGLAAGIPMGYAIDWFRDLTGIEKSERMPKIFQNASSKIKKVLAAGLMGLGAGLTGLVYSAIPDSKNDNLIDRPAMVSQQYSEK